LIYVTFESVTLTTKYMHKQRIIVLAAAALGLVACILPWLTVSFFGMSVSVNAFDAWYGWLAFGGFISALSLSVIGDDRNAAIDANNKKFVAGAGATALAMTLFYVIIEKMSDAGSLASIGIGAWLAIVAGIGVLAIPFVIKDDGNFEMPTADSIKDDVSSMTDGGDSGGGSGATEAAATAAATESTDAGGGDASGEEE
jgi:hypothetical protein